jgi:hypothetical protein
MVLAFSSDSVNNDISKRNQFQSKLQDCTILNYIGDNNVLKQSHTPGPKVIPTQQYPYYMHVVTSHRHKGISHTVSVWMRSCVKVTRINSLGIL